MEFLQDALKELIANSPIAAAILLTVWIFKKDEREVREGHKAEREAERETDATERKSVAERADAQSKACHEVQGRTIDALGKNSEALGRFEGAAASIVAAVQRSGS